MSAYIEIIRPNVCLLSLISMLVAAIIAGVITNPLTIVAAIAAFVITGAGNVINDYFDIKIDKINRPKRPLPSGRIKSRQARAYFTILTIIGIVLAYFVSINFLLIAVFNIIVLFVYSWKLKTEALIGNVAVAWLAASTFIAAGLITGSFSSLQFPVMLISVILFFGTLAREIIKDIEDAKGDKEAQAKTLPIIIGEPKAKIIGNFFLLVAIITLFIPYVAKIFGMTYLVFAIIGAVISLYSMTRVPAKAQKLIKITMYLILVGFLVASFVRF